MKQKEITSQPQYQPTDIIAPKAEAQRRVKTSTFPKKLLRGIFISGPPRPSQYIIGMSFT